MSDIQRYVRYRYIRTDLNPEDARVTTSWDDVSDAWSWEEFQDAIAWNTTFGLDSVLQSTMGNVKTGVGIAHFCTVCQHEFRESDLVRFRGLWYCKPNGHHRDIQSMLLVERSDAFIPDSSREAGSADLIITEAE